MTGADVLAGVRAGAAVARSSLRFGEWLVHGADGWFEVRFDVDDVVELVPITVGEAEGFLARELAAGTLHLRALGPRKEADVAAKTCFARYGEVLDACDVSMHWGATSESVGGASFRSHADLAAFHEQRRGRLVFRLRFDRRTETPHEADRLATLLAAVNARRVTVALELGAERGELVAAPAPFAGQPYGLATFRDGWLERLHLPFGAHLVDTLRRRLTWEDLAPRALSRSEAAELATKCDPGAYRELLATETVVLGTGSGAITVRDPAQADIVAKHVSDAFSTTLRFARKSS